MKKIKIGYVLFLILCLVIFYSVFPTYAKFSSDYITGNDVVGMDLNFNIGISNIEEYQEIKVSPNSHRAFNIEVNNYSDKDIYYGVWYKMINPKDKDDKIKIARVNSTETPTSGEIEVQGKKTVGIVIINDTNDIVKVAIGVGSSNESVNDIEYLSGKHLVVDYANIPINKNAALYIKDIYNDEVNINTVNVADDKSKAKLFVNEDKGILLDNNGEYRYYGINPDNYVRFNNELWRILSVSKVCSDNSMKDCSDRVKLIRNEALGIYSWNSLGDNANKWEGSKIETELNDLYYNAKSGICFDNVNCDFTKVGLSEESRKFIDNAMYYLGNIDDTKLDKMYANDFYNAERIGDNKYIGKVGLMYASDYAYSVLNISVNKVPYLYQYDMASWLRLTAGGVGHEYLIDSVGNDNVMKINYNFGNITNLRYDDDSKKWVSTNVIEKEVIRPVIYLKNDVVMADGVGTQDNPYTLKIN